MTHGIPETAKGPAIPDKGYLVEEIADSVYWVTDGDYQAMFLRTGDGVVVADAPPALGDTLPNAIREVTPEPVGYLIYTHSHWDHIGAAHLFAGATVIAHVDTAATLARRATRDVLPPT